MPTARSVSRWLQGFTMASTTVGCLQQINTTVIARVLATLGVRTWTIDVDGVVVSTGLQVERAFRGFNPHHRKVPSYYPIMAHLAETTHVLRVKNRSGNVHDGKAGLPFLRDLWTQLGTLLPRGGGTVRFRMDGAFFRQRCAAVARGPAGRLRHQGALLSLARSAAVHPRAADLATRAHRASPASWSPPRPRRGAGPSGWRSTGSTSGTRRPKTINWICSTRCHHGRWSLRILAVTSNLDFTLANLWRFACGRGNHEKTIAQLQTGLAFHTVPTMAYAANSAWQHLVVLTHNLLTNFQIETGVTQRAPMRGSRTVLPLLQTTPDPALRPSSIRAGAARTDPAAPCGCGSAPTTRPAQTYTRIRNALAADVA